MRAYEPSAITAYRSINEQISKLNKRDCAQVLQWLLEGYGDLIPPQEEKSCDTVQSGSAVSSKRKASHQITAVQESVDQNDNERMGMAETAREGAFDTVLQDLYSSVNPKTSEAAILVAAYWLENVKGYPSWRTGDIIQTLEIADRKVKYIYSVIGNAIKKRANRIEAVESEQSKSKTAYHHYRLTELGKLYIQQTIGSE